MADAAAHLFVVGVVQPGGLEPHEQRPVDVNKRSFADVAAGIREHAGTVWSESLSLNPGVSATVGQGLLTGPGSIPLEVLEPDVMLAPRAAPGLGQLIGYAGSLPAGRTSNRSWTGCAPPAAGG